MDEIVKTKSPPPHRAAGQLRRGELRQAGLGLGIQMTGERPARSPTEAGITCAASRHRRRRTGIQAHRPIQQ